jgi:hypothetical protein
MPNNTAPGLPSALLLEHRRLLPWPMPTETDQEAYSRIDRLKDLARKIWATPVRSWDDVVARAEVAAYWKDQFSAVRDQSSSSEPSMG